MSILDAISPTAQTTEALNDRLISPTPIPKPRTTSRPTKTPVATQNPIFTPSAPSADSYHYRLADLTPERMDELVDVMAHYPNALSYFDQGYHQENVFHERRHAALLLGEALLRFPNDERTKKWQWQRAKHLYIAGRVEAKEVYTGLILDALNGQQTDLAGLPEWFTKNEPEYELSVHVLTPLPNYQGSYLISVSDWANGFYFWLLESQVGYQAFQIDSYKDTGTAFASGTSFDIGDITGDGKDDVVIMHGREPGNFFISVVDFFDLGQIPPKAILFEPEPLNYEGKWIIEKSGESAYLKKEYYYDYFTCPYPTEIRYQWNGRVMEPVLIEDITHRTGVCIDQEIRDLLREAQWGNQIALDTLLGLVDGYPYDQNLKSTDLNTMSENQAELRFSLDSFWRTHIDQKRLSRNSKLS